jgi:hypothetical protein
LVLLAAIPLAGSLPACGLLESLLGAAAAPLPGVASNGVVLVVHNRSGLEARVEAMFSIGGMEVRRTSRLLAAAGGESTAEVIRTEAERVEVVARIPDEPSSVAASRLGAGFILLERRLLRGVDYGDGDLVEVVIPPAPADCNSNGVPDAEDIAAGAGRDCDGDLVPDECAPPLALACPAELTVPCHLWVDAAARRALAQPVVQDPCPEQVRLAYSDVESGQCPRLVERTWTASNDRGQTARCMQRVILVDDTPPIPTTCPATGGDNSRGEGCRVVDVPDFRWQVAAQDDCTPAESLVLTQTPAPGKEVAPGPVGVTITITDACGNFAECRFTAWLQCPIVTE